MLGLRCLTYISYKSWLNYNPHLWTISNKDSSLFDYAMLNWGHHLRLGQTSFDLASPYLLADSLEIGKVQTQLYLRDQRMDAIWVCLEFKLSNFTEALLAKGINPCCVDDRGRGLLHAAIEANDEKVARILLKIPDIDVDARDEDGKTALLTAVQSGRLEVLHLLLQDRRVDLTSTCKLGMNVLHRAVRHKSPEVLQLLLDYFYQISIKHPSRDLVHRNDCLDVLKYSGTEIPPGLVAQLDELQGSPTDIALLSVEAGDNSFRSSSQGGICLHDVAKGSNVSHLTKHLELMVPLINALDRCGRTPLIFAISHRRTASAQTLLDRSADTEIADRRGRTALYWAIKRADLQFVRMLIRSHANVNLRTKKGGTLLHEAAAVGILDLVKVLVEEGKADVRVTDANDKTAAEIAYWGQKKDIVQYLELAANTQLLRPTSSSAKRRRRATWPYKDICRSTSGLRVHPDEGPKFLDNPQEQIVDMTQKMRELLWMDFQEFLYTETGLSDSEDYP